MANTWRLELWDDLEGCGGTRQAVLRPVIAGSAETKLDGSDTLSATLATSTVWNAALDVSRVLRLVSPTSEVSEWIVSSVERTRGEGEGRVNVGALPVASRLGDIGMIRNRSTGGQTWHNLGGADGVVPSDYIDTYVVPALQSYPGTTCFAAGTVESTGPLDIAWDRWPPLQLLQQLSTRTATELVLRRVSSSGYAIDLLNQRGSTEPVRLFRVGRNVLRLEQSRRTDAFRTIIQPAGLVPNGGVESASIGYAAWRVDAPSSSAGSLTLADPGGGDGPVAFNDQITGCYLLKPDATLTQITSASTGQVLKVASATGLSSGDHVEVRADSAGRLLYELSNPAVASSSAFGRIVAVLEDATLRGERNLTPNPFASDWPTVPQVVTCAAASSQPFGTTVKLKGLATTGLEIIAGDRLVKAANPDGIYAYDIAADTTADGSGNATVSLSTVISVDNDLALLLCRQAARMPRNWSADHAVTGESNRCAVIGRRQIAYYGDLSAQADGAQNLNSTTAHTLKLKGLTQGDVSQFGDYLKNASSARYQIVEGGVATSSGGLSVVVYGAPNLADSTAVTIERQPVSGAPGTNVVGILEARAGYVSSPTYRVRFDSTLPVIWMTVAVTYAPGDTKTVAAPLTAKLVDGSGTVLATIADAARDFVAGVPQNALIQTNYTATADTTLGVRIVPPTETFPDLFAFVRWVSLMLGPDPEAPPVDGSHANDLWHRGNAALETLARDPGTYTVRLRDLAADPSYNPDDESLVLGAKIRLYDGPLGIDSELRVVGITADLVDAGNTQVYLSAVPRRLTDMLGIAGKKFRFPIAVDVAGAGSGSPGGGGGTGVALSSTPQWQTGVAEADPGNPGSMPPGQGGGMRITPPSSGGGGNLPPAPYNPPSGGG